MNKNAFTLSEVLITLGVIGVVSAMTIPTLIQNHKEQRTVAQLSKAYSTLSQAWQRMETEYGSIDTWGLNDTYIGKDDEGNNILDYSANILIAERLKEFLKVAKECSEGELCPEGKVYYLNGNEQPNKPSTAEEAKQKFYLNDGTFVAIGWYNTPHKNLDIYVILPNSKSNVVGKTKFYFTALPNKILPEGVPGTYTTSPFSVNCNPANNTTSAGRGCTAWVIYNKNLDYLHCYEKLSWNGKTKCK